MIKSREERCRNQAAEEDEAFGRCATVVSHMHRRERKLGVDVVDWRAVIEMKKMWITILLTTRCSGLIEWAEAES